MNIVLPQDGTPNGDKVHRVDKPVLPGALSEEAILVEKLQKELRTVAALEVLFLRFSGHACLGSLSGVPHTRMDQYGLAWSLRCGRHPSQAQQNVVSTGWLDTLHVCARMRRLLCTWRGLARAGRAASRRNLPRAGGAPGSLLSIDQLA